MTAVQDRVARELVRKTRSIFEFRGTRAYKVAYPEGTLLMKDAKTHIWVPSAISTDDLPRLHVPGTIVFQICAFEDVLDHETGSPVIIEKGDDCLRLVLRSVISMHLTSHDEVRRQIEKHFGR